MQREAIAAMFAGLDPDQFRRGVPAKPIPACRKRALVVSADVRLY
jgi:hypothetical protein